MTSLFSATVSPAKGSSPSLHCRPSNKPPLRALYDLLIAPMEVVCVHIELGVGWLVSICTMAPFPSERWCLSVLRA